MSSSAHGRFPQQRLRRFRQTPALRRLVQETRLEPSQLILPLFVRDGRGAREPVPSMPGVFQLSPDQALREAEAAAKQGVLAVILFGIPKKKDPQASGAYAEDGIVQRTVRLLKRNLPDLVIMTDVCLCEYTSHGHCGVVGKSRGKPHILNDESLKLLSRTATSHAAAGADIVAPSDMMDGRVAAIRTGLDRSGFSDTPILSYAAKYASAFYGPFRDAAESTPQFGDRRSYQMDPANADEALREVALDIDEGADGIVVKPAMPYLDILYRVKQEFGYPTVAYAVSGEYSMIQAAVERGWLDERNCTLESLLGIRRAGADLIITYAATQAARWLKKG